MKKLPNVFDEIQALKTNPDMQTKESMEKLVSLCKYEDWNIQLKWRNGDPYIQIVFKDKCAFSGIEEDQHCRKWTLQMVMKDTEVIDTVYAAVERAMMHEVKEKFIFAGRRIHNPHRNVWSLYQIATGNENIDIRKPELVGK